MSITTNPCKEIPLPPEPPEWPEWSCSTDTEGDGIYFFWDCRIGEQRWHIALCQVLVRDVWSAQLSIEDRRSASGFALVDYETCGTREEAEAQAAAWRQEIPTRSALEKL